MSNFVARAGVKTIDRNVKQLWRDGWAQIPEVMISGALALTGMTLAVPMYLHKVKQGPREYKFRNVYEVIRKDEIPPYLKNFPDCMN